VDRTHQNQHFDTKFEGSCSKAATYRKIYCPIPQNFDTRQDQRILKSTADGLFRQSIFAVNIYSEDVFILHILFDSPLSFYFVVL